MQRVKGYIRKIIVNVIWLWYLVCFNNNEFLNQFYFGGLYCVSVWISFVEDDDFFMEELLLLEYWSFLCYECIIFIFVGKIYLYMMLGL